MNALLFELDERREAAMSLLTFPTSRSTGRYTDLSAYPSTEQGWKDRYDRLWCAYLAEPYDLAEIKAFHLFRALDDQNAEIDITRRVFSLFRFITEIDVGGILGGRVALEVEDGLKVNGADMSEEARAALLVAGEAVWKRSLMNERMEPVVRTTAALGDYYIEAVRTGNNKPYRTTLVGYDPREVTPYYDQLTGTRLVKVVVSKGYLGEDVVAADGVLDEETPHTYRREITETRIDVWIDGAKRDDLSGEHGAGTIPVVHLQFTPFTEPDHGLPAAAGIDQAVMMCDSLATQSKAIGTRFANPIGYIFGVRLEDNSAIMKFGRWLTGAPHDAKAGYLEPSGGSVEQLRAQIDQLLSHIQRTSPEFMFADNETNVSGTSLTYKAAAFQNKVGNARIRIFGAICRITAIAVAMDADQKADTERLVFKIDAPPVLPVDAKTELEMLNTIRDRLAPGDVVRHLQRLAWVGLHEDPEEYAARVGAVDAALARAKEGAPADATTDAAAVPVASPTAPAANTALNGAQVQAAQAIVVAVAADQLPRATGVAMLRAFFNLAPEVAEEVMGEVGRGFKVAPTTATTSTAAGQQPAE